MLKFLRLCLYELNLNEKVCLAYENAFKKEPQNEDLFAQLYMAYAIDGEFKKQNLITMSLVKQFPQKAYRFWSVLSVYMQAMNSADQTIAQRTLYPLARRMIEKFEQDGLFKTGAEVELYLLILEKVEDYEKAIEVIDGKLGKLLNNSIGFIDKQKADYLLKLKKYDQAFELYVSLIEKNTDNISYYLTLIDVILLNEADSSEKNRFVIKLFDLFEQLKPECDFKVRGYYLARIELVKQTERLEEASYVKKQVYSNLPTIDRLLVEYFEVFGIKQAFIYDFFYLYKKHEFSSETVNRFVNEIGQQVQRSDEICDEEGLVKHSNYQALLQATGQLSSQTKEEKIKNFEQLVSYYSDSLTLKNSFTKTEFNHGDFYLQIAVHYLNELDAEQDDDLVLSLIIILERALRKCTANYTLKVFLIYLYNLIGAAACSAQTYEKLDIKYILYDSLGYLVFNELYLYGNYFVYSYMLNSSDKFFQTNSKETLDYLSLSYRHGNFAKVIEILKLEKRLNCSIQNFQVQLEKIYLDMVSTTKNYDQLFNWISTVNLELLERKLQQGFFIDNRDFSIYRTYDRRIADILKQNQQVSYEQALDWIKVRVSVLRIIWIFERIVSKRDLSKEVTEERLLDELDKALEQLKANLDLGRVENGVEELTSGNGLGKLSLDDEKIMLCRPVSRLQTFLGYTNNYRAFVDQVEYVRLAVREDDQHEEPTEKLNSLIGYLSEKIEKLKQFTFDGNRFRQIASYLCDLNCFVDLFSTLLLLITLTNKKLKQAKDKTYATEFNRFLAKLEHLINSLIAHLKAIDLNSNLNKKLSSEIEPIVYANEQQVKKFNHMIRTGFVSNPIRCYLIAFPPSSHRARLSWRKESNTTLCKTTRTQSKRPSTYWRPKQSICLCCKNQRTRREKDIWHRSDFCDSAFLIFYFPARNQTFLIRTIK